MWIGGTASGEQEALIRSSLPGEGLFCLRLSGAAHAPQKGRIPLIKFLFVLIFPWPLGMPAERLGNPLGREPAIRSATSSPLSEPVSFPPQDRCSVRSLPALSALTGPAGGSASLRDAELESGPSAKCKIARLVGRLMARDASPRYRPLKDGPPYDRRAPAAG
ncbi:hypothetical protein SKAU_G00306160 [Synaphobranchus kaupii]|uniref:Uncharacterized protein n=1 Tax=Synaphobranchus kaupii TaxID=118154 RepID=A0A9Q1IKS8_SYNKA|nr:hypothetical protein SKAU_G00306160 [Synaphobranchus kaupii]